MQLARIDGTITSSACHPSMRKGRAVICQPLDADGRPDGAPVLALDQLGAGLHQIVTISTDGSETRKLVGDERSPLRNHIQAIIDGSPSDAPGSAPVPGAAPGVPPGTPEFAAGRREQHAGRVRSPDRTKPSRA